MAEGDPASKQEICELYVIMIPIKKSASITVQHIPVYGNEYRCWYVVRVKTRVIDYLLRGKDPVNK